MIFGDAHLKDTYEKKRKLFLHFHSEVYTENIPASKNLKKELRPLCSLPRGDCPEPYSERAQKVKFLFLLMFIRVQLICNVALLSTVHQSESIVHTHISTLFQVLFPHRSLQSIEQFPVVNSRSLLVIYLICSSVYMSIPIY